MINTQIFEKVCKMSQKELKEYCWKLLCKTHDEVQYHADFIYAKGTFPVLLVAHLDTVHKHAPRKFVYDKQKQSISSPQGIGGDDRCGVFMIFEILKKYNCSVLFCEDEEIGGIGASAFIKDESAKNLDVRYIVELDRRGYNDAVFYDCANYDFEDFITEDFYKTAYGTFSDISIICPAVKIAGVNLSCGYYGAHTLLEYVVLPEMQAGIDNVCKLLERTDASVQYEYVEAPRKYTTVYTNWRDYLRDDSKHLYCIEYAIEDGSTDWDYVYAINDDEAVGKFMARNQTTAYWQIIDLFVDDTDEMAAYSY